VGSTARPPPKLAAPPETARHCTPQAMARLGPRLASPGMPACVKRTAGCGTLMPSRTARLSGEGAAAAADAARTCVRAAAPASAGHSRGAALGVCACLPCRPNISLGDNLAGLHAAFGTVMALYRCVRGGAWPGLPLRAAPRCHDRSRDVTSQTPASSHAALCTPVHLCPAAPSRGATPARQAPRQLQAAVVLGWGRWWTWPSVRPCSTCWRRASRRWRRPGRTGSPQGRPSQVRVCGRACAHCLCACHGWVLNARACTY
jgi:hypothetical protein